jgi:Tol biopolymer transport system component
MLHKTIHIYLLFSFLMAPLWAQENKKWDIEKPLGSSKALNFTTTEGTWINLDVSPDGKDIVFDLLGDIYKMPVSGGPASVLSSGMAYDVQPRFSPNGKFILYTSDKDGVDNIWVMSANGTEKHALTTETFNPVSNATWLPNSNYIIASKHWAGAPLWGASELWLYHTSGGLAGVQVIKNLKQPQRNAEPCPSADGKYLYFTDDESPLPYFKYDKNPYTEIYSIKKLNLENAAIEKVAGGAGGAIRPQISPNGKLMAFVKRIGLKSVLCVQNLLTGEEFLVYDDLSKDQQEAWTNTSIYPNFNWLPDNKTIVFYAKGKIRKVNIDTQETSEIPFSVDVKQTIVDALHFDQRVFTDDFEIKQIQQLASSPDGKKIVFSAAGYLYQKELPNGKPTRLTQNEDWEFEPSFSNDGKYLVYTTWNYQTKAAVVKYSFERKDTSILSHESGFYYSPKFSNKGDMVVYAKGLGNASLGYNYGKNKGIYTVAAAGGVPKFLLSEGTNAQFSTADNRIFFTTQSAKKSEFKSCDLNGQNIQTHYTLAGASTFCASPDNKWIAFTEFFNIYVTPMVQVGYGLEVSWNNKALPVKKISRDGGNCMHWSHNSKNVYYVLGAKYFTKSLKTVFNTFDELADNAPTADTTAINISLKTKTNIPTGKLAYALLP